MKKSIPILAGLLSGVLLLSVAGCGKKWYDADIWMEKNGVVVPETAAVMPSDPNFGDQVNVHDPSVFYDVDSATYYAFGTHYATATSTDLIHWTQYSRDGDDTKYFSDGANSVLKNIVTELNPSGTIDPWAPDVMKIGDAYFMYLSSTAAFGSNHSMIVRVRANNVTGPYRDEEVIVTSTGTGDPNCIDPELFYDKDGKLWMVYGSFFAGIYIKELDETGMPVENGFGKLLWSGGAYGVEGPFIFYNAELDYYYLMASDGSLRNDDRGNPPRQGNYSMYIARSKNPDGPYEDITGKDVSQKYGRGNKLAGNYQFRSDVGYGALGHNSVIKKDGKYLVVAHVRNRTTGDEISLGHHVVVHQLFFNEDGWPVLAPNEYAGESAGVVTAEQLAGGYDVVVHTGREGNGRPSFAFVNSVSYTLTADGKIQSGETDVGTWTLSQGYYVTVTLADVVYKGVAVPGWRNYGTKAGVLSITATSDEGGAIWFNAAN